MNSSKLCCWLIFLLYIVGLMAQNIHHINLPSGVVGPESVAFDCKGEGPYTGVADGRILKWEGPSIGWTQFATTRTDRNPLCNWLRGDSPFEGYCGRPLGLKFHPKSCELYVADAYLGLVKVGRDGGAAQQLVSSASGIPLRFTNDLDIDTKTGVVYFTDTSTIYPRWQWHRVIDTMDRTGRLLSYDPRNGRVSVLRSDLAFPNGVALSKNGSFVLVAETTTGQIQRFWLTGPRYHTSELFTQLGGRPDNIKMNADGDFWIAQNPTLPVPHYTEDGGKPVKMNVHGRVLQVLGDAGSTSDVIEFNNRLWLGSVTNPFVEIRQ